MIRKPQFLNLIRQGDFKELFVTELGWNRYRGHAQLPPIFVDDKEYNITAIAERSGFQILYSEVDEIPTQSMAKKIDTKLCRQALDYICIYRLRGTAHDLWVVPVRTNEKRDLVLIEYDNANAEVVYQKIDGITFDFDEQTNIVDLRAKVQTAFAVNSEKITKDFYAGFKKQHKAFAKFITGIDDYVETKNNRNKQWYASVMLNRLMFCYFIQKKGFLNLDVDYLRNKLNYVRANEGNDKFYNFYRSFLRSLFHDGLNTPKHSRDFEAVFGKIPYLNGGMFDEHQLEADYADIDIPDEAFIGLFDFFDKWNWHLDTRLTASGKDINPDVLGYIFEQYINDRAQMGAYYTKEDITEYIGRNCILPYLFDQVRTATKDSAKEFAPDGYVWRTLRESGDRYIFDAVKKGYNDFDKIPESIARGIITDDMRKEYSETPVGDLPDSHIPLAELRSDWNTRTPEQWGLSNEIWRESIDRLQRCGDILGKINRGEITSINDFITYNLDIRTFASDLIARGDSRFVGWFYHALQKVTILDPTCGSGAFLFAAMNILEPLYEICIDRMQEFNRENPAKFKEELAEITDKYRSNIQYFIFKSIILRNLYGVDIMVEATEIAKLRLFLKMVAVVDVDRRAENLGLDPLPDIDFNIRCGNTLVGYATKAQLFKDLNDSQGSIAIAEANRILKDVIEEEMQKVAAADLLFKEVQLKQGEDMNAFKQAKHLLKERSLALYDKLNRRSYLGTHSMSIPDGIDFTQTKEYRDWLKSYLPFHWLAEFYQIIEGNGGFDVIIGNPPYVEYSKVVSEYQITGYKTERCGNLYAYVMERCKQLISDKSFIGMIVPMSGHSTDRMAPLVDNFYMTFGLHLHLNLSADAHPQKLFEGVKFRLTIFFVSNAGNGSFTSRYKRWVAEERKILFSTLVVFNNAENYRYGNVIGKLSSPLFISIAHKINLQDWYFYAFTGQEKILYHNAPVNWVRAHSFVPYFKSERDGEGITTQLKSVSFENMDQVKVAGALLNSSLFFIWWLTHSDCYHLNKTEIVNFKYTPDSKSDRILTVLSDLLANDMQAKSKRRVYVYKSTGKVEYDEFYMKLSKPIIDKIDTVLARHYGFTDEELDFIINYDIKYRMGDELSNERAES